MTPTTSKAYLYCKANVRLNTTPKYVKKQMRDFIRICEDKDPKYKVSVSKLKQIEDLLKLLIMPKGLKAGQSLYKCSAGYQWLTYSAALAVVYTPHRVNTLRGDTMQKTYPIPKRLTVLHADTPVKMDEFDLPYSAPELAVGSTLLSDYADFRIVSAIWSREGRSDSRCREDFFRTADSYRRKCAAAGIPPARLPLSVEDLKLIGDDLGFLDVLAKRGVVFVAPFWRGENALGGGWDTDAGLTEFGRRAVARCFALGLIPDVSHASLKSTDEIIRMGEALGLPVVATHVGFSALRPHGRNLSDCDAKRIAALGGLVGVTFHAPHLSPLPRVGIGDAARHLLHGYSLCPDAVALGTDFDGTDRLPDGLSSVSRLPRLSAVLYAAGMSRRGIERIFSQNADRFFDRFVK